MVKGAGQPPEIYVRSDYEFLEPGRPKVAYESDL